ncbi:MAG: sigma-70 family RNA polymerase sigma factor [Aeromicrobium sp.]
MTEEDFRDLHDALRNVVFRFASRRVGSDAAHDVVSETFEVAWRKRGDFPQDRTVWASWIVGIAKNKVLQEMQRRSRKHHDNRFIDDWNGPHQAPTAEDAARAVVDTDSAQRIYAALTPAEQQLFDIAFLKELRPQDGARVLDISVSAFTSRVNRLRHRLLSLEESESTGYGSATMSGDAPL